MKIRVYYEDTDCGNVVYYANYLRYMERSRTELLRERGVNLAALRAEGVQFAVIDVSVKYRSAAKYDDLLDISSVIADMTSITVTFRTEIRNERGDLLVAGEARLACINSEGKARKIPPEIARKLQLRESD